eukprot:TRINITY_DN32909_c0_g1_i1.p1 TRINITY_DN32909_c0_g1~~TRINITY_DN32909_c0_g1_i1.p1  ORF type:complete len:286 (-),score=45.08 TRINITY_DN32909_c0_g1_i1:43-900(-)
MARIPKSMPLADLSRILPEIVDQGLPDGGEFLVAELDDSEATAALIALLVWHGFLPMAGLGMLLPKIHLERCVLAPGDVHVGRKVRRRAKGYHLSIDQAWPIVVQKVQKLTFTENPGDCWLCDSLANAYQAVGQLSSSRRLGVAFHSVELWHTASGELVAGEIGYTCGSVYSSCTGFAMKSEYAGAGSVQLVALARWLEKCGFTTWDLGMELDYKLDLGARPISRAEWARTVRSSRSKQVELRNPTEAEADVQSMVCGGSSGTENAKQGPTAAGEREGKETTVKL